MKRVRLQVSPETTSPASLASMASTPSLSAAQRFIFDRRGIIMTRGEAEHHISIMPQSQGDTGLLEGLDPETSEPYLYEPGDVSRELSRRYGTLDTSVATPGWMALPPTDVDAESESVEPLPPMRSDFDPGVIGQALYHDQRSKWYCSHTNGVWLAGSSCQPRTLAEQNEVWDNVMRNHRVRSDR